MLTATDTRDTGCTPHKKDNKQQLTRRIARRAAGSRRACQQAVLRALREPLPDLRVKCRCAATTTTAAVGTADATVIQTNTYTADGAPANVKDEEGNLTTYEYDGHDRMVKTRLPVSTPGANTSSTSDYEQVTYNAGSLAGR